MWIYLPTWFLAPFTSKRKRWDVCDVRENKRISAFLVICLHVCLYCIHTGEFVLKYREAAYDTHNLSLLTLSMFFATFSVLSSSVVNVFFAVSLPALIRPDSPQIDTHTRTVRGLASHSSWWSWCKAAMTTGPYLLLWWCPCWNDDNLLSASCLLTGWHNCQNIHLCRHVSTVRDQLYYHVRKLPIQELNITHP